MWKVSGIKIECTELRYFDEKVNILGKKGQQLFNIFFWVNTHVIVTHSVFRTYTGCFLTDKKKTPEPELFPYLFLPESSNCQLYANLQYLTTLKYGGLWNPNNTIS